MRRTVSGGAGALGGAGGHDADDERRRRRDVRGDHGGGSHGDPPGNPEVLAKNLCLRLLTVQARSRAELATKLDQRGIPADVAERVLDRLAAVGLVDDAAFAESFVTSRQRDRGLGRSALRAELRRKGIDRTLADRAVAGIDDESERLRAAALVAKKLDSAMFAGPQAARRRLIGMLARRGYSSGIAAHVVGEALRGYVDPDDLLVAEEDDPGGED